MILNKKRFTYLELIQFLLVPFFSSLKTADLKLYYINFVFVLIFIVLLLYNTYTIISKQKISNFTFYDLSAILLLNICIVYKFVSASLNMIFLVILLLVIGLKIFLILKSYFLKTKN
ncbi:hypothetical protein CLU81_3692 [Flavobacterium sp. 9]|nr:hypothetical protein CLU81_3692 [Flavobacterium sp. 9]